MSHASTIRSPTRSSATGRWISGGAAMLGVELLERSLQDVRLAHRLRASAIGRRLASSVASSIRSTTLPPRTWNTCTTAPAGPTLRPNASRSPSPVPAIFCCRCCSVSIVRSASRSCAACSKRSSAAASVIRAAGARPARRCALRETASCAAPPPRSVSSLQISRTHGAMQRRMSYSRHGRARSPVITSLHERMPNSRCVSAIVLRAELGRHERPRVVVVVLLDAARDQHARERLAGRQLQVGVVLVVAQQDVVARRALLDQVVLERQRLDDRVGDDELEPRGFVEQRVDARAHALRAEVAAHPVAQHLRLADVERVPAVVVIEVDARLLRQAGDPPLEVLNRHGLHCAFRQDVSNLQL